VMAAWTPGSSRGVRHRRQLAASIPREDGAKTAAPPALWLLLKTLWLLLAGASQPEAPRAVVAVKVPWLLSAGVA